MSPLLLLLLCAISKTNANLTETILHLDEIPTHLNKHELVVERQRLEALDSDIRRSLELTPQQQETLVTLERRLPMAEKADFVALGSTIPKINKQARIGNLLYQSDMVLSREQWDDVIEDIEVTTNHTNGRKKRQAYNARLRPDALWPKATVYYSFPRDTLRFESYALVREVFEKAFREWQQSTCIDFVQNDFAFDRLEITVEDDGCWSTVGYRRRKQQLNLGEGCWEIGTVVHEIGHILGFHHTHVRIDRNKYVIINMKFVEIDEVEQFTMETTSTNENYGIPYDFGSVMHYSARSFSIGNKIVIMPADENYVETMGSPFVSFYDLLMMNVLYGCLDKCKGRRDLPRCKMGGFPNPRSCLQCVCPGGYGGRLCDTRPHGCGKTLEATTMWQWLNTTTGYENVTKTNQKVDFKKCHYWIKAPEGRKVELRIMHYSPNATSEGCFWGGFEIKSQRDQGSTGYRFCSTAYLGRYFVSHSNLLPIITYSRAWPIHVKFTYRITSEETQIKEAVRCNVLSSCRMCLAGTSLRCENVARVRNFPHPIYLNWFQMK